MSGAKSASTTHQPMLRPSPVCKSGNRTRHLMEVLLADEYGFCFGVERAVEMVEQALDEGAQVRTLGPLIHNTQEIKRLEAEGVATINAPAEVEQGVTAVIRAHGVTPEVQRALET